MRIMHLIDSGGLYGAEKMLLALCIEQCRAGHDARVLSARLPEEGEKAVDVELRKASIPVLSWPLRRGIDLKGMREIHQWAAEHRIDVLHSHGYKFNVLLALTASRTSLVKVTTVHGYTKGGLFSRITLYNALDRLSHCAFDRIAHVSEPLLQGCLVRSAKAVTIPNGIDIQALPPATACLKPNQSNPGSRLIAVGRLAAEKDYELLLHALRLLHRSGLDIQLDIFGEGPEKETLQHLIERENLHNARLCGYSNDIPRELLRHDVLVASSKTEGMPITLIEAMCLGVKIVSTAVGGIPSLLKSYPLATLVDSRRPADLADAIKQKIQERNSLGVEEQERLRSQFSSAVMAQSYVQLYEKCLEDRRVRR